ncbi:phospho-sugar mutase [Nanchangia anserum]|uniref:Phospho-sugar mutase n=1 Tax=Nanchangia anserum TaxID=2692125 RepID=A0A8I0G877_9ACTO|nr:phospho-sugar mutase [Nanchangia anserum]MBD3689657.1 phospho-sugar mutase [Nanchangia anserum]QOX81838.1 phospho-sugar mutase [Nanchangia anserum]
MAFRDLLHRAEAWVSADPEPATRNELAHLINKARQGGPRSAAGIDLASRFRGSLTFGTAGLRGRLGAGETRMNRAVVIRTTAGLMAWLTDQVDAPRVVIGCDARHGSAAFARDVARVVSAAGGRALVLPPGQPTPLTAFAVRAYNADAGVMITASHNPATDNGYKVYTGGRISEAAGVQIIPPADAEISAHIERVGAATTVPTGDDAIEHIDPRLDYINRIVSLARPGDIRIVLTPMHGVGRCLAHAGLTRAGFTDLHIVAAQADSDPNFPTVAFPNPEEDGALDLAREYARRIDADLVIALDPDADRCAVCVPEGTTWRQLSGDEVGMILADDVARRAVADKRTGTIATSVVSTRAIASIAAFYGLKSATTLTGFKWIARVPDLIFGCEEAIGYCPDPDAVADKDGIATAILVCSIAAQCRARGRTLLDLLDDIAERIGPSRTRALTVRLDDPAQGAAIMASLRANPPRLLAGEKVAEVVDLASGWRGLPPTDAVMVTTEADSRLVVRPSGTEPKIKCYLEASAPVGTPRSRWGEVEERLQRLSADVTALVDLA